MILANFHMLLINFMKNNWNKGEYFIKRIMTEIAAPHNKRVRVVESFEAHCALKNTIIEDVCQDIVNRLCCNVD